MVHGTIRIAAFDELVLSPSKPPINTTFIIEDKKAVEKQPTPKACPFWGSVRMVYTICAFLAMVLHVYMRTTINFVILCMVKQNDSQKESPLTAFTNRTVHDDELAPICGVLQSKTQERSGDLEWSRDQELWLQGAFFYGYVLVLPMAGRLADRLGGKLLFVHSITGQALLFLVMPLCARFSYYAMAAVLIAQGLIAGSGNPAIYQLFSTWAHPSERTALVSFAFGGYALGAVLVFPISSRLCQFGWPAAFYGVGTVCLVCGLAFQWLVYSTLEEHPRLTRNEYDYLSEANRHKQPKQKQAATPWRAILTSVPVHAYTLTHIFHSYGLIVFTTMIPRYFSEAMRFPMDQVGLLSSAPFLGSLLSKILTITTCSAIEKRPNVNMTRVRRITYVLCNCLTIICIVGMVLAECQHKLLVVILTVVIIVASDLAFSGAYFATLLDMAPAYSGLIAGISNCLATTSGFLAPILISQIVHEGLKAEWDLVMMTLVVSYGLGAVVYGFFGNSTLQKWAQG